MFETRREIRNSHPLILSGITIRLLSTLSQQWTKIRRPNDLSSVWCCMVAYEGWSGRDNHALADHAMGVCCVCSLCLYRKQQIQTVILNLLSIDQPSPKQTISHA